MIGRAIGLRSSSGSSGSPPLLCHPWLAVLPRALAPKVLLEGVCAHSSFLSSDLYGRAFVASRIRRASSSSPSRILFWLKVTPALSGGA